MPRTALVVVTHHKPWLGMSTVLTALAQDTTDFDLVFARNVGGGKVRRPSYEEYYRIAARCGENPQLSDYDRRVLDVTRLPRGYREIDLENDHSLAEGAYLKVVRDGLWKDYDRVAFMGEGTLFARPDTLSSILGFMDARKAHFVLSAHEKQLLPRDLVLAYNTRWTGGTELQRYHDRMIAETFGVFCRDPAFREIYDAWASGFPMDTQNHVPDVWPRSSAGRHLRIRASFADGERPLAGALRRALYALDGAGAAAALRTGRRPRTGDRVHRNGASVPRDSAVESVAHGGLRFHQEEVPQWFGCGTIPFLSREFLMDLHARMDKIGGYEAVDLPFSATALEIAWGFFPAWLGYERWFTDGIHRTRKHFVTLRREDDPEGVASYVNRYWRGDLHVSPVGDYLRVEGTSPRLQRLRQELPPAYFSPPSDRGVQP